MKNTLFTALSGLILATTICAPAMAAPTNKTRIFSSSSPSLQKSNAEQPGEIKPVRMGKARFIVSKNTVSKTPDGKGYQWDSTPVCDQSIEVPVFDLRGLKDYWYSYNSTGSCVVAMEGKQRKLFFGGGVVIAETNMVPGQKFETKSFVASAGLEPIKSPTLDPEDVLASSAWTRDLNLRSMGLSFGQTMPSNCTANDCTPALGEYVQINVEIED